MIFPNLEDVKSLYSRAEAAIRLYERIGLDNLTASLNELQYVGQHILRVEAKDGAEESKEDLFKAYRHCERALYDAKESTILCLLGVILGAIGFIVFTIMTYRLSRRWLVLN